MLLILFSLSSIPHLRQETQDTQLMFPDKGRRRSVVWTPLLHPPNPDSLHIQNRHLFMKVLEAMKTTSSGLWSSCSKNVYVCTLLSSCWTVQPLGTDDLSDGLIQ